LIPVVFWNDQLQYAIFIAGLHFVCFHHLFGQCKKPYKGLVVEFFLRKSFGNRFLRFFIRADGEQITNQGDVKIIFLFSWDCHFHNKIFFGLADIYCGDGCVGGGRQFVQLFVPTVAGNKIVKKSGEARCGVSISFDQ
jgi:hypothetical protein